MSAHRSDIAPGNMEPGSITPADSAGIAHAAAAIQRGELVGMPTETVYGLAADALNPRAAAAIFAAKERPSFDPLIVHLPDPSWLPRVTTGPVSAAGELLMRHFWPGPLTLVLPKGPDIPEIVTSGLNTVAVRVPDNSIARELMLAADRPLAAPSANRFGQVSPTRAEHVQAQLGASVAAILDGGPCRVGVESTIVSLQGERPVVLRFGGVPVEAIESLIGPVEQRLHSSDRPEAPGQLSRHYATQTPLQLLESGWLHPDPDAALLVVSGPAPEGAEFYGELRCLSPGGDLTVAAHRLFASLRELDQGGFARIDVIPCEPQGLGRAILDRLRRASVSDLSTALPHSPDKT